MSSAKRRAEHGLKRRGGLLQPPLHRSDSAEGSPGGRHTNVFARGTLTQLSTGSAWRLEMTLDSRNDSRCRASPPEIEATERVGVNFIAGYHSMGKDLMYITYGACGDVLK